MPIVLLIDDEVLMLNATRRQLRVLGFQVTVAGCFADAVALLAAGGYDVIVSDFHLDLGKTAVDLFPAAPARPLVLHSGRPDAIPDALRGFAAAVVEKPYDWRTFPVSI